jgi:type I restriction-modification system DNA methylase subunit
MARGKASGSTTGATLGLESKLWSTADSLWGSEDSAEYKHVILGLVLLKYISNRFDERQNELVAQAAGLTNDSYIEHPAQHGSIRVRAALSEYHTLAALHNTLLPRLLSGQLRVREADRVVGQRT